MFWSGLVLGVSCCLIGAYVHWVLRAPAQYNLGFHDGYTKGVEAGREQHESREYLRGFQEGRRQADSDHRAKRVQAGKKASATRKQRNTITGD